VALLYVVFGIVDLTCSLAAFQLGFPELNPFLRWMDGHGLFVPAKLAMTGIVAVLVALLYSVGPARLVAWSGIVTMMVVTAYHLLGLNAVL
jgi:hypothetical protein